MNEPKSILMRVTFEEGQQDFGSVGVRCVLEQMKQNERTGELICCFYSTAVVRVPGEQWAQDPDMWRELLRSDSLASCLKYAEVTK